MTAIISPKDLEGLAFYKKLSTKTFFQPIPLSEKKLRERGFNQAFLITKFFRRFFKFPIADFLIRVKETKPQAELKTKKDRYNNLKKAFKIKKEHLETVSGVRVILVDDVITSGSTVREAAKTLKKAGASKVYVFALARG